MEFRFFRGQKPPEQQRAWRIARPVLKSLEGLDITEDQRRKAVEYARPDSTNEGKFYRGITLLDALQLITEGMQTSFPDGDPVTYVTHDYSYAKSRGGTDAVRPRTHEDYARIVGKAHNQLSRKLLTILETPVMLELEENRTHGVFRERKETADDTTWVAEPPIAIADLTPRCVLMFQTVFGIDLNRYRPSPAVPQTT